MKRSPIFLLLLLLLPFALGAQNLGSGLVLGINFSQVDGDAQAGFNQLGLSAGTWVAFELSEKLVVQPELLYDQLGARDQNGILATRFHYITVPLLIRFRVPVMIGVDKRYWKFEAGPAPAVLLSARDRLFGVDLSDQINQLDLRATVGSTFDLSRSLSIGVRYYYSLTSIVEGTTAAFAGGAFHNYFQLSLRFKLVGE